MIATSAIVIGTQHSGLSTRGESEGKQMVMILERRERAQDKLIKRPDGDRLAFEGGIGELTGELSAELCPLYLQEIGSVTFLRKLGEQSFDAEDLDHVAEFLMKHDVKPNARNCFRLILGARLNLEVENWR